MSIIQDLITDRTQADVNRVRELALKGWTNLTEGEKAEWNAGMKGAYNATDLNRVTQAMDYINAELEGYGYVTGYQKVKVPHEAQPVSPLPDGYVQLEYIESTRTQYIDTGFNVTANTQIDMSGYVESYSTNFALFGARSAASSTNDTANLLLFMANGTIRSDYYGNSISATATISGTFDIHRTKNVTTVNSYTLTNAESTSFSGLPLFLFAANTNGSASLFGSFRLYSCQIYDNETIVRDFIPCIDPDGEVGLYDLVNGEFYGNSGTGVFTAGPNVQNTENLSVDDSLDPYTWYESDVPTASLMGAYLANVEALRSTLDVLSTTPETPESMAALTWAEANDIERILIDINTMVTALGKVFLRAGMPWAWAGNEIYVRNEVSG